MANITEFKAKPVLIVTAFCIGVLFYISYMHFGIHRKERGEVGVKISEVIAASIDLVQRGGRIVKAIRSDESIGTRIKGKTSVNSNDYVTEGDTKSHQAIVSGLKSLWPSLKFVSEEHDAVQIPPDMPIPSKMDSEVSNVANDDPIVPIKDVLIWIDPLDATQEYTEGGDNPELLQYVTVMMCVAVKGNPVAGIIHQVFTGENGVTYWGWVDHGFSSSIAKDVSRASIKAKKTPVEGFPVNVIVSRSHAGTAKEEVCRYVRVGIVK